MREMVKGMIEASSKREVCEGGREVVQWLIVLISKRKREQWREVGDRLIKPRA